MYVYFCATLYNMDIISVLLCIAERTICISHTLEGCHKQTV